MRPLLRASLILALPVACNRPTPAPEQSLPTAGPAARVPGAVFRDSALFRALCMEADSIRTLAPLPARCTPRDQSRDQRPFPLPPEPRP